MTNDATANSVLVYNRGSNGALTLSQTAATQGLGLGGTDGPLMSAGSLTMSSNGGLLLAVNAGSNQVTSFTVTPSGLQFAGIVASGGTTPTSVAIHGSRAYVVNSQGTPNIMQFKIASNGVLTPVGGPRKLPGGASAHPAQVLVTPDGKLVVVTERVNQQIDLFPRTAGGHVTANPASGPAPYGFTFGLNQVLIVTEAMNSAVSSYTINEGTSPSLSTITGSLLDTGMLACWVILNPAKTIAYVSNSGSHTISTMAVDSTGALSIINAKAASLGATNGPIDIALTHDGNFLYAISSTSGFVSEFSVSGGTLTALGMAAGVPASAQGIAAW